MSLKTHTLARQTQAGVVYHGRNMSTNTKEGVEPKLLMG